jgi:hypothetical protein
MALPLGGCGDTDRNSLVILGVGRNVLNAATRKGKGKRGRGKGFSRRYQGAFQEDLNQSMMLRDFSKVIQAGYDNSLRIS